MDAGVGNFQVRVLVFQLGIAFWFGWLLHAFKCWMVHGEQLASYCVWRDQGYTIPEIRRKWLDKAVELEIARRQREEKS